MIMLFFKVTFKIVFTSIEIFLNFLLITPVPVLMVLGVFFFIWGGLNYGIYFLDTFFWALSKVFEYGIYAIGWGAK